MGAKEHYDSLLGDHYSWMLGDYADQVLQQRKFFDEIGLKEGAGQLAIDLGAGTGIQSVALAQNNFKVIAVDFCEKLLLDFRKRSNHSTISFNCCNILDFLNDFKSTANVITCMGDTVTHLQHIEEVSELIRLSSRILENNGKLIISYRDLSSELTGIKRFIPVRSDDSTIMTCFLEYEKDHVRVHDIIHTREQSGWTQKVSWYPKLRLAKSEMIEILEKNNLKVSHLSTKGMTFIVADRCY